MEPFAFFSDSLKRILPRSIKLKLKDFLVSKPKTPKKWQTSPNQLPWFDQPNAIDLLEDRRRNEGLTQEEYDLLHKWVTDGYCVVSGIISDQLLDSMSSDIDQLWTAKKPYGGLDFYGVRLGSNFDSALPLSHADLLKVAPAVRFEARDNSNWRVHSFHEFSSSAKAIFENPELIRLTSLIFGRRSVPSFSINFMYGSEQDAHQDSAVFHIFPPNYIIGAWVACEDISPESGPLMYYPKSHREPLFSKFDNYPETNLRTSEPRLKEEYFEYLKEKRKKYERHLFLAKKGEILLWHAGMFHGGSEITDPKRTRRSFVIHYVPPKMNVADQIAGPFAW